MTTFLDACFLNGQVAVRQPPTGFRAGLDAVMLAAAVPARAGQSVLELGAGAGTASLCLAARVQGAIVTGLEIDEELVELATQNAAANSANCQFVRCDIFDMPYSLKRDFGHVFCNPPFHREGEASSDPARAMAMMDDGRLCDWLALGLKRTISGGTFTTILRADRMGEAMSALPRRGITALPLQPGLGSPAKRVILRARKGSGAPFLLLAGLVLHGDEGEWTPAADAVLRRGEALALGESGL